MWWRGALPPLRAACRRPRAATGFEVLRSSPGPPGRPAGEGAAAGLSPLSMITLSAAVEVLPGPAAVDSGPSTSISALFRGVFARNCAVRHLPSAARPSPGTKRLIAGALSLQLRSPLAASHFLTGDRPARIPGLLGL